MTLMVQALMTQGWTPEEPKGRVLVGGAPGQNHLVGLKAPVGGGPKTLRCYGLMT